MTDSSDPATTPANLIRTQADGLVALAARLEGAMAAPFAAAVDLVLRCGETRGRVVVTGMGKSGHVGRKIAATFASTGTPAYFVHPGEASHGDLGVISRDDVIIALSWSGETVELKDLLDYAKRFRVALVAVTASEDSSLAKAADVALILPAAPHARMHDSTSSPATIPRTRWRAFIMVAP